MQPGLLRVVNTLTAAVVFEVRGVDDKAQSVTRLSDGKRLEKSDGTLLCKDGIERELVREPFFYIRHLEMDEQRLNLMLHLHFFSVHIDMVEVTAAVLLQVCRQGGEPSEACHDLFQVILVGDGFILSLSQGNEDGCSLIQAVDVALGVYQSLEGGTDAIELFQGEKALLHARPHRIVGHQDLADQQIRILGIGVCACPPLGCLEAEIVQLIHITPAYEIRPLLFQLDGLNELRLVAGSALVGYERIEQLRALAELTTLGFVSSFEGFTLGKEVIKLPVTRTYAPLPKIGVERITVIQDDEILFVEVKAERVGVGVESVLDKLIEKLFLGILCEARHIPNSGIKLLSFPVNSFQKRFIIGSQERKRSCRAVSFKISLYVAYFHARN